LKVVGATELEAVSIMSVRLSTFQPSSGSISLARRIEAAAGAAVGRMTRAGAAKALEVDDRKESMVAWLILVGKFRENGRDAGSGPKVLSKKILEEQESPTCAPDRPSKILLVQVGTLTLTPCPPPLSLVWLVCFLSFTFFLLQDQVVKCS